MILNQKRDIKKFRKALLSDKKSNKTSDIKNH